MGAPDDFPAGVLLVDKPAGWTSHDVVAKLRRAAGQRRAGHTGTLDPLATGLLVLAFGRATRLVEYATRHDKQYEGLIRLGASTTTDDSEGAVVGGGPVPTLTPHVLLELERAFSGELLQRPPAFSAISQGGRRAYDAARAGQPLDLPPRPVTVRALSLTPADETTLAFHVSCSAGTYVRALARDLGQRLGCGGHIAALRRTAVGALHVRDALPLAELVERLPAEGLEALALPEDELILDCAAALVGAHSAGRLATGLSVTGDTWPDCDPLRVYDEEGAFRGIGRLAGGELRPVKVFSPR